LQRGILIWYIWIISFSEWISINSILSLFIVFAVIWCLHALCSFKMYTLINFIFVLFFKELNQWIDRFIKFNFMFTICVPDFVNAINYLSTTESYLYLIFCLEYCRYGPFNKQWFSFYTLKKELKVAFAKLN